jgi:acyl-CoA synthetase (AMP-forming)/AMP-acid ligase II
VNDELRLPDDIHTIPAALTFWAEQTPHAPALLREEGPTLSHGELHGAIAGVAARLIAHGIGRDGRVALVLPGGDEAAVALLGMMAVATAVPFNPAATPDELTRDLERLSPRLLVLSDGDSQPGRSVADALGIPIVPVAELVPRASARSVRAPLVTPSNPDDVAIILHTSGTTGLPKRVPRSHRSYVATARAARDSTNLTRHDVALLTSGLHTNMGVANLCAALLNGGACVVVRQFDPTCYGDWLDRYGATWAVTTNTELTMILNAAEAAGRSEVAGPRARLRVIRAGAQALAPGVAERIARSLHTLVFDGFGMTEASYIAGDGPAATDRRPGSCGRPISSTIRILDPLGNNLPPGVSGDIIMRGPTLFAGYLDDPDATADAFLPGGWFRTGDIGYLDEEGYVYLTGRATELINRGGEKIAPLEVDHALLSHPQVAEAAAFAVSDARLGEDVVAVVVRQPGSTVTARALRSWLLDRLSPTKVPRRIIMVERIPRTPNGKVQRGELARRWHEERR